MASYHFWRKLLDADGREVTNGIVYVYLAGTTTLATIFDGVGVSKINPIITDDNGILDFYINDHSEIGGYVATQKFKLTWVGADIDGDLCSGEIDNINVFPNLFQVDETDNISATKANFDKLISNELAYEWSTHITETWEDQVHDLQPVDIYDSNDATYNKLVSNYLMNQLDSLLASASSPSIESTGAVFLATDIGLSGGADPVKWLPSAGTRLVYADVVHNLNKDYPVVHLFDKTTNNRYTPYAVIRIDIDNLRVFSTLNVDTSVSIIG